MKKIMILFVLIVLTACTPDPDVISINLNEGIDIITVGESHIDEGCIITINDIDEAMLVESNTLDELELGEYEINYTYEHKDETFTCKRIVKVIDDISPVVTLNPGKDTIKVGEVFVDGGIIYNDNYDGTDVLVEIDYPFDGNTVGRYIVTYTVTDSSFNETVIIRVVNVIE